MEFETILLKLFSGPHLGGQAELPDGEHVLGRDANCEIVLDDVLVEPQHCRLVVTGDEVRLEPLAGQVYVEGELFSGGRLDLFDYVMIGSSCFSLGTSKSQWPVRPLPVIRRDPPSDVATATGAATGLAGQVDELKNDGLGGEPPAVADRKRIALLTMVGAALIVLLLVASLGMPRSRSLAAAENTVPMEERLWEVVRSQAFESDVQIVQSPQGWRATGYLRTRKNRNELIEQLRQLLPSSAIRLWDSESLADAAQQVLTGMKVPLEARPGSPGEVVVSGQVKTRELWERSKVRIVRDIAAIRSLQDNVTVTPVKSTSTAAALLAQMATTNVGRDVGSPTESYTAEVSASEQNERSAQGQAPVATPPQVEAVTQTAPADISPATLIRNVYLLPPESDSLPHPSPQIRSVNVGHMRSLILVDGTRVMLGGRLDGWMVMKIEEDQVVLERGRYRHIVDLLSP